MDRDLITTGSPNMEKGYYTIHVPGMYVSVNVAYLHTEPLTCGDSNTPDAKPRRTSHEEAGAIMAKAWDLFVDVDGQKGRTVCPLPHAQLDNFVVDRSIDR